MHLDVQTGPTRLDVELAEQRLHADCEVGTRSTFDAAMRHVCVDPNALDVALVLPSSESVRTAVESGAGVTALSALVVAPALAAGTLHALRFDLGVRPFHGLRHKGRYWTKAANALLELIGRQGIN